MEIASAIALLQNVIYKPGWSFEAVDHSNRFEGTIKVKVNYPALNSNRDQVNPDSKEQSYPEVIVTYATFPILVAECTDDMMLYRRLINFIIAIEEHEAREFLRIPPTNWAPFHPHKVTGMREWHRTSAICHSQSDLVGDLQFGVV